VRITGSDDVRDAKLDLEPAIYVPVTQTPDGMNARNNRVLPITWVVRTAGVLPLGPAAIQRELHQVSAELPLERIRTMHEVVAALALSRVTVSVIFGIKTWDPAVLVIVAFLLGSVALFAAYIPSLRATRVNPADALRR
jgi:hypothetical protein